MIRRLIPMAVLTAITLPVALTAQSRDDFHWDRALPAGNEVSIQNVNGDIKVRPSTNGKVEIVGIKRGNGRDSDHLRAQVDQTSRGIVVCVIHDDRDTSCDDQSSYSSNRDDPHRCDSSCGPRDRRSRDHDDNNWGNASIDFEIAVPANLRVSASSVSGDVSVTGAQGDVRATSVSGDIRLDRLRPASLVATSVSGDVSARIDEFSGRGDLTVRTVSGDVTLDMPKQLDADLSMTTVSGTMDSDYPITLNGRTSRRRIDARIGNGGRRLDLVTVSGDVKLRVAR